MSIISLIQKAARFALARPQVERSLALPKASVKPLVARRVGNPKKGTEAAAEAVRPALASEGRCSALISPVREIRRRLRACRGDGPAPKSHKELLKIWDLQSEEAVNRAILENRLRIWIFLGAGLAASLAILAAGQRAFVLAPLVPAVLGAATSLWRLSILRSRSWRTFPGWLGDFASLKSRREKTKR